MLNKYTVAEAARRANATEDEIRAAIKDGLLLAKALQNTGEYHIDEEELARWLRRSRRMGDLLGPRKHKVLLVGTEALVGGSLKLELARDKRLDVRAAGWGRDGALLIRNYLPSLYVVELASVPTAPGDEALAALVRSRAESKASLVVQSNLSRDELVRYPERLRALDTLRPDEFVSPKEGSRWLVIKCFVLLGLDTNTQVLRRQV